MASMAPLSLICLSPLASMILSAFFAGPHGLEHVLGDLAGDGVVLNALEHAGQHASGYRAVCPAPARSLLTAPENSPITQLAEFGSLCLDHGLVEIGHWALAASTPAS
jgi:hypothetical protein